MTNYLQNTKRLMALLTALFVGSATTWASSGALNGVFTINENNDKVVFSQGNLQYQASTGVWRFAESQWSFVGYQTEGNVYENGTKCDNGSISATYSGWIDMFGWGTSGWNNGNTNYMPWSSAYSSWSSYGPPCECDLTGDYANADWGMYNAISNGGNQPGQWRTMSSSEWVYLLGSRNTSSGIRFAKAIVNGVKGLLLLPDSWSASVYSLENPNVGDADYEPNTITIDDWNNTLEPAGVVFLPAGGARGSFGFAGVGTFGEYWTTTSGTTSNAYELYFGESAYIPDRSYHRCDGRLVRLVQPATATSFIDQYFTIKSLVDNNTITLTIGSAVTQEQLQSVSYSTDNGATWNTTAIDNTTQTISVTANAGDKVCWKGLGTCFASGNTDETNWSTFTATGQHEIYGNIMSLLYGDDFASQTVFPEGSTFTFYRLFSENTTLASAANLVLPAMTLTYRCYSNIFRGCTSLVEAPELPATTLADYCYQSMFYGCTSLGETPALPATTLAHYCYLHMFNGCTSLTQAPALPATSLIEGCYQNMFQGCTSLTEAPALPATILADYCYDNMFRECTSLVQAPVLPATTLGQYCYRSMFYGCTSLTEAPMLPATTLAQYCYLFMFSGCTSLVEAPELPATSLAYYCYQDMFSGCTSLVEAPELPATSLIKGCYQNMFKGCTSLVEAPELPATTLADYCYDNMFRECTSLVQAPVLPATTLGQYCYSYMFYGCTSLTEAPALPATTLAEYCYIYMFSGCTSLAEAPELPATTLVYGCYQSMFQSCTSLTEAPALPATSLASRCYDNMFQGCTSLTEAPALPATTLAQYCYNQMFWDCTSLTEAPALPATTLANGCYWNMFYGCTSLTEAPALPATTLAQYCYYCMFQGCTSLTEAPALPATTLAQYCYERMFFGCTSLAVAPALPATTMASQCYHSMFQGCTSLTVAPALPATTMASQCYRSMFQGCTSLNEVTCLATDISAENCTTDWLSGVAATGTFHKNVVMEDWPTNSASGIPTGWNVEEVSIVCPPITATANPAEGGTVSGAGDYYYGSSCTLTAEPNEDWAFVSWSKDGIVVSCDNPYSFVVMEGGDYTASFIPLEGNHVIGEGSGTNEYLPSYSYYKYTLSQQIYTAEEIGESGNINNIAFFNAGGEKTRTYDIYLVHTAKTSFESNTDWIAVTEADRVYSGSVTMAQGSWTTIVFNTPFAYDGVSNLAVVIDDNSGNWTEAPHMACRVFDTESAQAIRVYNDDPNYNPYSPSGYTGTLHNVKNQVIFGFERYTVTATANPAEGGTVTGGGLLLAGSTASLAATANSIFEFVNWTENGEVVSTANPYEFEVTEDRNLVANFEMGPITNHWTSITGTQYNMTMSGLIYIDGEAQTSTALEIGAFCGDQCRGSALAQFFPPTGEYVVSLTVVSNQLNGETITFRLYDHISQQEYPTECINSVTFNANDNLGTMGDWYPFAFYYAQETTALANGWTWWSTSVELSGIDGLTMLEESLGHNGLLIKSSNKFVQNYYPSTGYDYWFGQLTSADFNNESSYMIQTSASCEVTMTGTYANPSNHPIQLYPDWTWIGYPCGTQQNTNSAFADFTPTNKDVVKGQYAFSTYYENYGWFPELTMTPGLGYMYQSLAQDNRTLTFANGSKVDSQPTIEGDRYWRNNVHDFANNMNVIAVVNVNGEEQHGDDLELGAFVDGECRGSAALMYFQPTGRWYAMLTVSGEDGDQIEFGFIDRSKGMVNMTSERNLVFQSNAVIGELDDPCVIGFGTLGCSENGLEGALHIFPNPIERNTSFTITLPENETLRDVFVVNMMGEVVAHETNMTRLHSIQSPGVYTVKVVCHSGNVFVGKLIVK